MEGLKEKHKLGLFCQNQKQRSSAFQRELWMSTLVGTGLCHILHYFDLHGINHHCGLAVSYGHPAVVDPPNGS
jgi:hypothetical protein